jgi:hypothetical protein
MHRLSRPGESPQKWVFDENTTFHNRFSLEKWSRSRAALVGSKGPSVVHKFAEESAWAVWKRLGAEGLFRAPNGVYIPSLGPRYLS